MRRINQFYVGAEGIAEMIEAGYNADWTHSTEAAALAHAKRQMEDDGNTCAIVVKITHVLKQRCCRPVVVVQKLR